MTENTDQKIKRRHLIIRHWQGDARLWQSYWLIGVAGGWVFWTLILNLVSFGLMPDLPAVIILAIYSIYAGVGVWRCAPNADWVGWGYIARAIIALSFIYFIYEFFQLSGF